MFKKWCSIPFDVRHFTSAWGILDCFCGTPNLTIMIQVIWCHFLKGSKWMAALSKIHTYLQSCIFIPFQMLKNLNNFILCHPTWNLVPFFISACHLSFFLFPKSVQSNLQSICWWLTFDGKKRVKLLSLFFGKKGLFCLRQPSSFPLDFLQNDDHFWIVVGQIQWDLSSPVSQYLVGFSSSDRFDSTLFLKAA